MVISFSIQNLIFTIQTSTAPKSIEINAQRSFNRLKSSTAWDTEINDNTSLWQDSWSIRDGMFTL